VEFSQDLRLMMGRKFYSITNYAWEKSKDMVDRYYNRSLALGIFSTNTKNYSGGGEYIEHVHEGVEYANNPDGYFRDKEMKKWFLPKARMLYQAGWEPSTLARKTAGGDKVYIERFGNGNQVYFTVFNDSESAADVVVKFDLKSLGMTEGKPAYQEISYDAKLEITGDDEVRFKAEPFKAHIISVTKTWKWGDGTKWVPIH